MSENKSSVREPLFHLAKRASISAPMACLIRLLAIVLGFIACGVVAFMLIDKLQDNPEKIEDFYKCFIDGIWSKGKTLVKNRKLWKFLKNLAILQCISLAVTPAFRMKFWNIGAEGQTLVGVLGSIAVAFYLQGSLPNWLLLVLMLVAAILSSIIWAIIPAIFKAVWNTNETLFTLMMNYVATFLVEFFLVIWVKNGSSTLGSLKFTELPSFYHDYFVIVLVALILSVLLYIYLKYSKQGYEVSVVGESVRTAQYSGINVKKVIIRTMVVSGLLCGVAAYLIAAGLDKTVTSSSVGGQGFTAIMVSWLAKFNPIIMLLTSGLISMLNSGAEEITKVFDVRGAMPDIIIGTILFFIIGSEFFINYTIVFRKKARITNEGRATK